MTSSTTALLCQNQAKKIKTQLVRSSLLVCFQRDPLNRT
jgi:hypothetical protein